MMNSNKQDERNVLSPLFKKRLIILKLLEISSGEIFNLQNFESFLYKNLTCHKKKVEYWPA